MSQSAPPKLIFDRSFTCVYERAEWLGPRLRRLTVKNPGPFTFTGTNTYIVGTGEVAIIDPGPDDAEHLARLMDALRGEKVSHILVTHTHKDHSPLSRRLKVITNAPIYAEGSHRATRTWDEEGHAPLEASNDIEFTPDHVLKDGEQISGTGWTLEAIATPGHTTNHMAYALLEDNALVSGDHIMAWSTSIIAPPDGSMKDYMASLEKTAARPWSVIWPGHGGPIHDAEHFIPALIAHRRQREHDIAQSIKDAPRTIMQIVDIVYAGLPQDLKPAAALSVFAHLEDLHARGIITAQPAVRLDAVYKAL